jgi:hypothetical protein
MKRTSRHARPPLSLPQSLAVSAGYEDGKLPKRKPDRVLHVFVATSFIPLSYATAAARCPRQLIRNSEARRLANARMGGRCERTRLLHFPARRRNLPLPPLAPAKQPGPPPVRPSIGQHEFAAGNIFSGARGQDGEPHWKHEFAAQTLMETVAGKGGPYGYNRHNAICSVSMKTAPVLDPEPRTNPADHTDELGGGAAQAPLEDICSLH